MEGKHIFIRSDKVECLSLKNVRGLTTNGLTTSQSHQLISWAGYELGTAMYCTLYRKVKIFREFPSYSFVFWLARDTLNGWNPGPLGTYMMNYTQNWGIFSLTKNSLEDGEIIRKRYSENQCPSMLIIFIIWCKIYFFWHMETPPVILWFYIEKSI